MQSAGKDAKYLDLDIPRKIALGVLFLLLFLIPALSYAGPRDTAGYWIKKLDNPDEVVLSAEEIRVLNSLMLEGVEHMAEVQDMPDFLSGEAVSSWLSGHGLSGEDGAVAEAAYNAAAETVPGEVEVRFGVVTERADVRALPTDTAVRMRRSGTFDALQYTSVYPGEPVALLHTSRDGEWGFVQTQTLRGWVRLDRVAFAEREYVFGLEGGVLVATGSKVKVYLDGAFKEEAGSVPMGATLRLSRERAPGAPWPVWFPVREEGGLRWVEAFVRPKADVHMGHLPYTRRNIIRQAFKMLGEEYGWGGRDGLRDCSLFIKDLFSTVGLKLPRNSRQQGSIGDVVASAAYDTRGEIKKALMGSDPGVTLLTTTGHVMLHIGTVKGRPYVIHQIFGYRDGRKTKVLKQVAVTSLELGKRSKYGPMKNRLRSVTRMTIPAEHRQEAAGKSA